MIRRPPGFTRPDTLFPYPTRVRSPGNFELLANYGYNQLRSEVNSSLDYMPRHIASIWSTKTFGLADEAQLRLGAGIVYSGKSKSTGPLDPYGKIGRAHV